MSKYSVDQVAKFHELRREFMEAGASPYLATGAAFFAASGSRLFGYLLLRKDETGSVDPVFCSCGEECCGTIEGAELVLGSGEARKYFPLVF